MPGLKAMIRIRISHAEVHYAGNLVSASHVLGLFGDVATELLIRQDGDEGLFRAYDSVEFLAPVRGGDFLEVEGEISQVGNSSRRMTFEARKVIEGGTTSVARVLEKPIIVAKASGTCVAPKTQKSKK